MMERTSARPTHRALAVLAVIAAGVWGMAGYRIAAGTQEVEMSNPVVPLGMSNRTQLNICVDSKVADVGNDQLKLAVESALPALKLHPDYVRSGLPTVPTQVDQTCPGPARAMMPGFDYMDGTGQGSSSLVTEPSRYVVFVFVVPPERLSLRDGSMIWRVPQEIYCHDGRCGEVTTALYLTAFDLSNPDRLAKLLTDAVGLEVPELRPDYPDPGER